MSTGLVVPWHFIGISSYTKDVRVEVRAPSRTAAWASLVKDSYLYKHPNRPIAILALYKECDIP